MTFVIIATALCAPQMSKKKQQKEVVQAVMRALLHERVRQNISMNQLAKKAGLSQSTVSLLENRRRSPGLETLLRITEALNLNLGKVLQAAIADPSMYWNFGNDRKRS